MMVTIRSVVLGAAVLFWPLLAVAQTATSTATSDLSCARDRTSNDLTCTAGEFTTIVNMTLPPGGPTTCVSGSTLTLSLIVNLSGTNANRYDGAMFIGQASNDPRNAGGVCSVSRFPLLSTGNGFTSFDGDACGDYLAAGVETWRIDNVKVLCRADASTGRLAVPYLLSYQQINPGVCPNDASTLLAPGSPSKCNAGTATVPTLVAQGYVRVTKQTLPGTVADTFAFTAASSLETPSPTAFNLGNGQSQRVDVNITGTPRTLTITEGLRSGWESTASIVCTNPSGGAAPYVTVNNATRTITATLDSINYGAECTITNTRQTRVRTSKALVPTTDPGLFNLAAATATVNNVGNGGATAFAAITAGNSATFAETAGSGTTLGAYSSTYRCVRADTGTELISGSGTTASFIPPAQQDTTCTFTNTRNGQADLRLTKTNTPGVNGEVDQATDEVTSGAGTSYSITVTNLGPDAADGAVLSDPAPTNLTCTTANCTSAGGASCPAQTGAALVTALQGAGATIPALPLNGTVTVTLTCTVN